MKNKFNFYEIVVIQAQEESDLKNINGKEGVVMGMAQCEDGGWAYAITVDNNGWTIEEKYLIATGKVAKREDFYSDDDEKSSVKVVVDKSGKGRIKGE
jgi:hypothetical protein